MVVASTDFRIGPTVHWNEYIPHYPLPKQLAFLSLERHMEVFYGGSAGGGKSDALLMGGLQFVHLPDYHAIIFRRTLTDLELPGSLIDRAHDWLDDTDARWDGSKHQWKFPSGSILQFGYIGQQFANQRYQSAEFQYVAFDEVAQHREFDYLFMFSRLRKLACSIHGIDDEGSPIYVDDCLECSIRRAVPIRMRSASNPPRAGDAARSTRWLEHRFQIKRKEMPNRNPPYMYVGTHPTRLYIPATHRDNKYIDQGTYRESLGNLDPVTREQLLNGDWGVYADGRFKIAWRTLYRVSPDLRSIVVLDRNGNARYTVLREHCEVFQTIDPAASSREGPGDEQIWQNKDPSSTVISTWLMTPRYDLLWWDCEIHRVEIPDVISLALTSYRRHKPKRSFVEASGLGIGVYQSLNTAGINVQPIMPHGRDKLVRATQACIRMEQGRISLPENGVGGGSTIWKEDVESQLWSWVGHPREAADIIDTLSYAAIVAYEESAEDLTETTAPRFVRTR